MTVIDQGVGPDISTLNEGRYVGKGTGALPDLSNLAKMSPEEIAHVAGLFYTEDQRTFDGCMSPEEWYSLEDSDRPTAYKEIAKTTLRSPLGYQRTQDTLLAIIAEPHRADEIKKDRADMVDIKRAAIKLVGHKNNLHSTLNIIGGAMHDPDFEQGIYDGAILEAIGSSIGNELAYNPNFELDRSSAVIACKFIIDGIKDRYPAKATEVDSDGFDINLQTVYGFASLNPYEQFYNISSDLLREMYIYHKLGSGRLDDELKQRPFYKKIIDMFGNITEKTEIRPFQIIIDKWQIDSKLRITR